MALIVTKISGREHAEPDGAGFRTWRKIAFDSSYPTGGEALTAAELGFTKAPDVVKIPPKSGYVFEYDHTNAKVIAYVEEAVAAGGPLVQVANTTDLSAVTDVLVEAHGLYV